MSIGAYHEVGVDAFHIYAFAADLLGERAAERREEGLGSCVGAEHGRCDAHAGEGAHVDDQTALPAGNIRTPCLVQILGC